MLDQIHSFVMNNLPAFSVGSIAVILEFAFRLFPTEKPRSFMYAIPVVFHSIGDIFSGIAMFLDKVLPQKIVK